MNVDAAVYARLSGFAGLTALVGGATPRIRPVEAPQSDVFPYVVYSVISDTAFPAMSVNAKPHRARVQVSSFAKDFDGVRNVAEQARLALSRFRGTAGGIVVQDIFEDNVQDLHADVNDGVFQRARDFIVYYEV